MQDKIIIAHEFIRGKVSSRFQGNDNFEKFWTYETATCPHPPAPFLSRLVGDPFWREGDFFPLIEGD